MDECQNVINFGKFDKINVDDATECKMVNIKVFFFFFLSIKQSFFILICSSHESDLHGKLLIYHFVYVCMCTFV